jgi:hypothetical protein
MHKRVIMTAMVISVLATMGLTHAAGVFSAFLSGAEEVPPVATDTFGRARIVFNEDDTAAEFMLQVRAGVGITQAHIHCGAPGVNGPIVVFLAGFNSQGYNVDGIFPWISNATVTDSSVIARNATECPMAITNLRDLIALIRAGLAYANVHSLAYTGGVVRGQLVER